MKKKIIILTLVVFCVLLIGFVLVKNYIENNETKLEKEQIEIEILSVSTKGIRIEITNNDKNEFLFGDDFILKKQGKHGWRKVEFKDGASWPKTLNELKSGESLEKKIIWVDYFDKELSKGEYRMEWNAAGTVEFELEKEDVTTKILSVSSKEIKIEITNNGNNNFIKSIS